jgi:Lar family restriction alleviation protein
VAKKLKPCPFCGDKKPKLHEGSEWMPKDQREYYVMCRKRGCEAMLCFSIGDKMGAIKKWNRRDK